VTDTHVIAGMKRRSVVMIPPRMIPDVNRKVKRLLCYMPVPKMEDLLTETRISCPKANMIFHFFLKMCPLELTMRHWS
jgi:hypothetical protein